MLNSEKKAVKTTETVEYEPVFLQTMMNRDEREQSGEAAAKVITDDAMTDRYSFAAALLEVLVRFGMTKQILIGLKLKSSMLPFAIEVDTALPAQEFAGIVRDKLKEAEYFCGSTGGTVTDAGFEPSVVLSFDEAVPIGEGVLISVCITDRGTVISYDPVMYSQKYIESFRKSLMKIYDEITTQKALKDILLVPADGERHSILLKNEGTVNAVFKRMASAYPDKKILFAQDRTLTYRELDEEADRLAGALAAKGVEESDRVLILMRRTSRLVAAVFGVVKAGGVFITMDPTYPQERIRQILEDSKAKIILTDVGEVLEKNENAVSYDELAKDFAACTAPVITTTPESPCFIIYTSGTTGRPKGVVLTHMGITNYIADDPLNTPIYKLKTLGSRMLCLSSVSFIVFLREIFGTILNGVPVVLANEGQVIDPAAIAGLIKAHDIDVMGSTPTRLIQYLEVPAFAAALERIKLMIIGGEGFPGRLYDLIRAHSKCEIYNSYGPTEVTIASHQKRIESGTVSAGFPMLNVWDRIADIDGGELPAYAVGNLYVAGAGVARGYWGNDALTEERFPIVDGVRYCNTGDLAYKDETGEVFVLGRLDGMVKLRGFRIELGEVENVLGRHEAVADARAFVREIGGTNHLVVFYTLKKGAEDTDPGTLRSYMAEKLPAYMVPTYFTRLEAFPLTPNGKVSVKELKTLPVDTSSGCDYEPPRNETEKAIKHIIGEVIGTDGFGIRDNLFNVGLTSLSMISVLTRINEKYPQAAISVRDIFAHPTVEAIAEKASEEAAGERFEVLEDYPLSQTQKGILAECLAAPDSVRYNITWLYRLSEDVDTGRLRKAVEAAILAHPYLSASLFVNEKGEYRVRRSDEARAFVSIEENDSSAPQAFDLTGERLYRAKILKGKHGNALFLEFHHLIYDGTSEQIFLEDINAAYEGKALARETYTGYEAALSEEKLMDGRQHEEAKAYYDAMLSDLEQDMLPEGDSYGEEEASARFTCETNLNNDSIKAFCESRGVTENAFFNSAFALVISRFTGQEKGFYTTVYNGRSDARLSRSVAMFVRTFPVLCPIDPRQDVAGFIKAVQVQLGNSMANDSFSFAEIAHTYGISADILFIFQGEGFTVSQIGGKPAEAVPLTKGETKAPITIEVLIKDGHIEYECEYRSDLYTDAFIKSMLSCLSHVADEFMIRQNLDDVSLIDDEARARLDSFNQTEVPYDKTQTVVSLFAESAQKHADRTAVIFNDVKMSYQQLDELTDKIAAFIAGKGLGRGDVVSVMIPRCEYMPVASLGILKAGCAYQPLDPAYPEDRLNFMVRDSSASLLITTRELSPRLSEYKGEVLYTEDIPSLPKPQAPINAGVVPEDLFILLYTSGSTGVPKGVRLTHGNIVCFAQWCLRYYALDSECAVGAYASYGFDMHMMDTYPTLIAGATEVIVGDDKRLDLAAMNAYMEQNHVSHMFMTTQVGRQFAINVENHSLKALTVGGEKLVTLDPPAYPMFNGYGPTECTCLISIIRIEKKEKNIPIGLPLDNVKLYVVGGGKRLPVGAVGELWAAGPHVGSGYLNRPEKTQEVFVDNPWDGGEYGRCYRTGDVVRYLQDGRLEFIGRRDGQVKVRGFRIELTEIEAVLRDYPGIKDATVAAFDHPSGGKSVAAYVVGDEKLDTDAIAGFIRARKPDYMVPAAFIQLDAIPLNQNGKVNRRMLPKPEPDMKKAESKEARKPDALDNALLEMIKEAIGTDVVSFAEPLIQQGMTSITSIMLSYQLSERFGIDVPSRLLLTKASLESIKNSILTKLLAGGGDQAPAEKNANPREEITKAPLSYAQMGVYYECMKRPAEVVYNIPTQFTLSSETKEDKLLGILSSIVEAHPVLSAHFELSGGEVFQMYGAEEEPVPVVTIKEAELAHYRAGFVRPFDLRTGPLCRFAIARTEKALYLLTDFHHLVFDGYSQNIFTRELSEALGGKAPSPEKYSYYAYISEQKAFEETPEYEENRRFFDSMLGDFEKASVIEPDVGGAEENGAADSVSVPFDYQRISDYCRRINTTPAALLLAAASYAVSRYTAESHIYLSTISTGRGDIRTADTFGMFVNTLALGISIEDETCEAFVRKCFDVLTGAMAHERYPFARIASDYGFEPDIMYEYQVGVVASQLQSEPIGLESPKFKLSICIEEREGQACVTLKYNDALYSQRLMQGLATSVVKAAETLTAAPNAHVKSMELCDEAELRLLDSFNEEGIRPYDDADTVVSMFRRAASANADRKAVIYDDRVYSYREADDISERIAAEIIRRGFGRGSVAAILIPRGEYMALASLGVLKAGAAYQPLDSSYPPERLNYMVKDSNAGILITTHDLRGLITDYDGEVLYIEDVPQLPATSGPVGAGPLPDDLFILLYTSGSTGVPKGVRLTHRNLVNFINWYHRYYALEPADCVGQYASYGFDACMMDMYPALTKGAAVCIIPEAIRLDLNAVNGYLEKNHVTHQFMTTQIARQFAVNIDNHSLKHLSAGGEKLVSFTPKGKYTFHNGYGPTECTIFTTTYKVTEYEDNIPIGKPLDNLRLYVVDKDFHRLPVGALGELWVTGPQVGDGYMNLPERSREVFVDNPFGEGKAYRTGDIVRYRSDGNIEFIGRKDAQVKIRGFRIELTEVEAVIRDFPGVTDATVAAFDHASGQGKFIAAYVVGDERLDIKAIRDFIGARKPPYMMPASIMQIDRIPLNQNQKVNKRALPEPVVERGEIVTASSDAERAFCEIFREVLNLDEVGVTEDFFALGGSSILVTLVLVEAEKAGFKLTYQDIFSHTTPRALAGMFEADGEGAAVADAHDAVRDYDYGIFAPVLAANNLETFKKGQRSPLGDILLTGATGYLGIHVLHELLENHKGRIYCLLRGKRTLSARKRLEMLLGYYFSNVYEDLWDNRLFVVDGDITGEIPELPVNTVINCAAVVKHFSTGTEIEDVNTGGVRNLVDHCLKTGARFIQVSTMSTVSMFVEAGKHDEKLMNISEQDLYFGQQLDNKYTRSKFLAERLILEAVTSKGLDAKIMRVGNLAARFSDGEFQVNYGTNSFMGRLRVYSMLGVCPFEQMDEPMEFSPIDEVAKAILLLAETPRGCVLFHTYDHNMIRSANVFKGMEEMGIAIKPVEKEEFEKAIREAGEDPIKARLLTSMLAYSNWDRDGYEIPWHNAFTMQVLYRMGYRWPDISEKYVKRFTGGMIGLGYFDLG